MMVGTDLERCPRCGETKPRTAEHWYVDSRGKTTGYCRICQKAYLREYGRRRRPTPGTIASHRLAAREWFRRTRGTRPENYRRLYPVRLDFARASRPVQGVCW